MRRTLFLGLLFLAGCASTSDLTEITSSETLLNYSGEITSDFLQTHLEVIAHDSLEGRFSGMRGQKIAADYLADFYHDLGISPKGDDGTYFQHFTLNADYTDSLVYRTFRVENGDTLAVNHTVESGSSSGEYFRLFGGASPQRGDVVFAGFGLNDPERDVYHLDADGLDLKDRWVMIFEDIPYVTEEGDTLVNPNITSNSRLRSILVDKDAAGILLVSEYSSEEYQELAEISSMLMTNPSNISLAYRDGQQRTPGFPKAFLQISPEMAANMLGLDSEERLEEKRITLKDEITTFRPRETSYFLDYTPYDGSGTLETENVIAYMEGADPDLRDEVLVLVAHYDHIGITQPDETGDMINNGADDNGSGTVALMAIANALQKASNDGYRPKRSILFLHVSAEELGLLGSRYYSDHPVIPIEQTVASFNADMIGRSDPENIERGDTDYVYLIGGEIISSGLDSLVTHANSQTVDMRLDRRYNDLQDRNQFYRRSDHWNFGRLGVPFVFFFTGVHEDYHAPSDTVDKIDFEKLTRVTRLIFASSIEVMNYEGRPVVDNREFIEITRQLPR